MCWLTHPPPPPKFGMLSPPNCILVAVSVEEAAARPRADTEPRREVLPEPIEAGAAGRKALQARGPEARSRARMQVLIKPVPRSL